MIRMKIAFIGTHGVGKTTLAYRLCNELKRLGYDVGYLDEVARRSPFPVNEATSLEAQIWIIATTIAKELELGKVYNDLVCDRAVIDNYVYLFHKFGHLPELFEMVKYWARTYDFLFKVSLKSQYLRPDGFRSLDRDFQRAIDNKLNMLLAEANIPYFHYVNLKQTIKIVRGAAAECARLPETPSLFKT